MRNVQSLQDFLDGVAKSGTRRVCDAHVRNQAWPEETLVPCKRSVNELVNDDEAAGRVLFFEGAHRGEGQDVSASQALEDVDVGAKVQVRRRDDMTPAMARKKTQFHAI
mmetsp:Transcript_32417/g.70057  ORF Transcript_32417/g.70057 Transcript_32417/m.70057 type:complete len:109 (-) Transcript_32417:90-416(-)